jgi:outer membrane receptor protein involved in Fe transport
MPPRRLNPVPAMHSVSPSLAINRRLMPFAVALSALPLFAQTVPPSPSSTENKKEEILALSPFEVRTDQDTGYAALNSNSITRFNTELNKLPVSADIFTEDFIRDVGATTIEGLLAEYGAGMGLASSNPEGDAELNQPGDRIGNMQVGVRGLAAGMVRRDGFTPTGSFANPGGTAVGLTETFDVEAAEVIRGPQGLLYGASGAGGTINTRSKRANFNRHSTSVSFRFDQFGSKRANLDYNFGKEWFAVRVSLLGDRQKYRRVFIGHETEGLYAQLAFKLPFRTILRVQAQHTANERINPTSVNNLNYTNANNDPRHNYSLAYLLATNRHGETDPVTGARYPGGAIANGGLNWGNLNSWAGRRSSEYVSNNIFTVTAETVWSRWLSSQVSVLYNDYKSDRIFGGIAGLSPRPITNAAGATVRFNSNPLNDWANAATPQDTEQPTRRTALRGSFVITNKLFRDRALSQTNIGYDVEWVDAGPTEFTYYLADANWNVIYNPAIASNLGRTPIGQMWWPVGSSPVEAPFEKPGWASPRLSFNGQNYVRMERNPRDAAWVRPNNPLGLASLAGFNGVSGQNNRGHHQTNEVSGFYVGNYTSWFDDRFGTLLGARGNKTFKSNPNTSTTVSEPWATAEKSNSSYNVGLNAAVRPWLRAFYSLSNTYNTPIANANDPLGNPPKTSSGTGQEAGLKFTLPRGISGSLQYYWTDSKDEMVNAGTGVRDLINPVGINNAHDGPAGGRNQWINLDRTTRGLELILTAAPTRNWRMRFAGTTSDGQNLSDKVYPLLYNDQFHLSAAGNVTYENGQPFLVPIDAPTIAARIQTLNAQINPATIQNQGTWVQLTRGMINDPSSPYYATPANDNGRLMASNLRRVLVNFVGANGTARTGVTGLPLSDLQYAWSDPNRSGGQTIVARSGEKTTGYAEYRFSLTNMYSFSGDNFLKGLSVGGTVSAGFKNRTYYYNSPDGIRRLFSSPDLVTFNLVTSYRRKFGRYQWQTQINVNNLFNHYKIGLLPANGAGFTSPADINATFYGQPRMWFWTNTVSF